MKTDDIFITDREIDEAFQFMANLQVDSNHAINALTKTFVANATTMSTLSRSALCSLTLEPAGLVILASCFYIIGLNTGLRRAETASLEKLLTISSPGNKESKEGE